MNKLLQHYHEDQMILTSMLIFSILFTLSCHKKLVVFSIIVDMCEYIYLYGQAQTSQEDAIEKNEWQQSKCNIS